MHKKLILKRLLSIRLYLLMICKLQFTASSQQITAFDLEITPLELQIASYSLQTTILNLEINFFT